MTLLSGNMHALAQSLLRDHETRMQAVSELRTDVKSVLNNYRTAQRALSAEQEKALKQNMEDLRREVAHAGQSTSLFLSEMNTQHRAMTSEQRQKLDDHLHDLRAQVVGASQAAVDFLKEIEQERKAMNVEQRRRLGAEMDDLHSQVNNMRQATVGFLGGLDKSNQAMADELNQKLTSQHARLSTDTAFFISSISTAHQEMATQQSQDLGEHFAKLQQSVNELRQDAAISLKTSAVGRRASAMAQKKNLVHLRNSLSVEVSAVRASNYAKLSAVRADQAEAAKIWASISQLKQKGRKAQSISAQPEAVVSAWVPAEPVEATPPSDDLKTIHGIGPGMAKLLNEAGISSFAKLAASTPEQIHQALGKIGNPAKVEVWIARAQELI